MRDVYGCDCDGITRQPVDAGRMADAARGVLRTVEHVTGYQPPTCPWRAMSEPIVREVLSVAWAVDPANLSTVLGPDPDHKLVQAIGVYVRAKTSTKHDNERLDAEEAERERSRKAALAGAARGRRV